MRVAFLHTLREAFQRRMSLVLLVVSFLAAVYYVFLFQFETAADGSILVQSPAGQVPVAEFMQFILPGQLNYVGSFWLILGALAAVPLLVSFHETGWVELLVSKGVSRWELLLGRYLAALVQFVVTLLLVSGVPALHIWLNTGISTWPFLQGVGLMLFSYACTLALSTLLAVVQANVGLVAVATYAQIFLSGLLTQRKDLLKEFAALQGIGDFLYYALPKNDEMRRMSIDVFYSNPVDSWAPLWSSGIFLVVALAAACLIFQRKSL